MSIEKEPTLGFEEDKKAEDPEEEIIGIDEPKLYAPHYEPDENGKMVKTVTDAEWKKMQADKKALSDATLASVKKDLPWNQPGHRA